MPKPKVVFLVADQDRRPGAAQLGIAPAHGDVELRLARQLDAVEKRIADDVGDIDALGGCGDGEFDRFVHDAFLASYFGLTGRNSHHEDHDGHEGSDNYFSELRALLSFVVNKYFPG